MAAHPAGSPVLAAVPGGGARPVRRQVMVRGVRVNDLVGRRFMIGEVECLGTELCEPCLHLQSLTRPGIIKELIHRGGLRADIVSGGTINVGDRVLEGQYLPERIVEPLPGTRRWPVPSR